MNDYCIECGSEGVEYKGLCISCIYTFSNDEEIAEFEVLKKKEEEEAYERLKKEGYSL